MGRGVEFDEIGCVILFVFGVSDRMRGFVASKQLQEVIDHYRRVGERVTAPGLDLGQVRAIAEDIGAVNESFWSFDADVSPVDANGVPCEWILGAGADPNRRLLCLHGGGFFLCSLHSHRPMWARISAATGCAVLAVDYRLAPEHPFPSGLEDCLTAYEFMRDNGPGGPHRADSVFVAGDSAGGNLALALLVEAKERGLDLPDAAVAMSPGTDATASGESRTSRIDVDPIVPVVGQLVASLGVAYVQDPSLVRDPRVSPLFGDLAGLPPLLVQVGDAEILLSDSTMFVDNALAAGVDATVEVWEDMPHVFHAFAGFLPEADQALSHIAEFLQDHS